MSTEGGTPGKTTLVERESLPVGDAAVPGKSTLVQGAYGGAPDPEAMRRVFLASIAALALPESELDGAAVAFSTSIPASDRQFFVTWMKHVGGGAPVKGKVTPRVIALLHDLDRPEKAALRAKVIARLKDSGVGPRRGLDVALLHRVIAAAEADAARDERELTPDT